ncbi:MAG: GNAT family N-acetyltransferase [Pirellula sp.]
MDELRKEMTWEEYLVYPRKLGWKHEYFDGALHLSPAWTAVTTFRLSPNELLNREVYTCVRRKPVASIRPLQSQDQEALLTLFCECFDKAIEYSGSGPADLMRYAHRTLDRFFSQPPPPHANGCRVAVLRGSIVGCSMIAEGEHGVTLQPIFVAPREQRQGIATLLLVATAKYLADHGIAELWSQCNLGNEASMEWHVQCGFTEIPTHFSAGHRANIYMQEAERQERLQLSTAQATRALAEHWANERDRLDPWTRPSDKGV